MANLEHAEDEPKHVKMSGGVSASAPATPHRLSAVLGGAPGAVACLIPSFTDACKLVSAPYSCLVLDTHKRHIALSPMYLNKKRTGIQEELNTELLKYSEGLKGVPLAYDNICIVRQKGDIYDDSGYIHLDIEASFVVFQPQRGQKLLGVVNKLGVNHAGCLVHGCFNASVPKPGLVSVDTWREAGPRIGAELEFEVTQLDADTAGVLLIRGRLDRTWVQELMAMAESSEANVDEEQRDTEPDPAPEPAPEPAQEPAPAPGQDSPDGTPRKKKKKKKDKHKEEEREVSVTLTPPGQQGGGGTAREPNGTTDGGGGGEETAVGEKSKKKKKKDKQRVKEEEEEVEICPAEVQGSDSSGYVSDKPNKRRRQEAGDEDVVTSAILNGDPETPKAKKKRKSDLQQAA